MLLDCFMFFRELDLLEGRLEYLYNSVDYFIIVEADVTHSGNKKELNFLKNIDRFKPYLDKIIYQPISIDTEQFRDSLSIDKSKPESFSWKIENAQRRHLDNVLKLFDDDAYVMISDLDEIPLRHEIPNLINLTNTFDAYVLIEKLYFYNFNQYSSDPWPGTVVAKNKFVKAQGAQWLRDMRFNIPKVFNSGYHLSYWGSAQDIKIKLENFAHQDINNPEQTNLENIEYHMQRGLDPFNRVPMIKSSYKEVDPDFYAVFKKYVKTKKKTFIQIGAGAGDRDPRSNFRDGFTEYVKSFDPSEIERIILVEANPMNIDKLYECWADYPEAMILNLAVCGGDEPEYKLPFHYAEEDAPHYHVASLSIDHVLKHYPDAEIKTIKVEVVSFQNFIKRCVVGADIDMLALDIEGLEADIILETDWKSLNISQLSFEKIHLGDKNDAVTRKLSMDGYLEAGMGLDHNGYDILYKKID